MHIAQEKINGMLSLDVIHRSGNPTQNSLGRSSRMMANHSTVDNSINVSKENMLLQWCQIDFFSALWL